MRLLDLFSGTKSVSKVAIKMGYETTTLDLLLDADIKEDIMTWDYKKYPTGYFKVVAASPVCSYWSALKNSNIGRPNYRINTMELIQGEIDKYGKPMVDKIFEIIDYFKPKYWWIENPQTGKMKTYIKHPKYYDVDYCRYGMPYKKSTRFWTNIEGFKPLRCELKCGNIQPNTKKHLTRIGRGMSFSTKTLYRIPETLIYGLLELCI